MKVVKVRSPFIIEVNEAGAIGSKIELFIYSYGSSVPATPTYTLSKLNPSATQLNTAYNVSNFVKEYIDNIKATYVPFYGELEQNNEWVKFQVKRYKLVGTTYTLLNTTDYIGVNGFTDYTSGNQEPSEVKVLLLSNPNINNYYYKQTSYPNTLTQYFNLLVDKPTTTTTTINVKYERIDGVIYEYTNNLSVGGAGIFNFAQPITPVKEIGFYGNFVNGCKVTITYTPAAGAPIVLPSFYTYPIEECKYTPVLCDFVNRYGGWQTITFFKSNLQNIETTSKDFNLLPSSVNYNVFKGQKRTFNQQGKQKIKCNTGWVDENYFELIQDLLLSEVVLLDNKPVIVKSQSLERKTHLKDKNINYEIEFEYNYGLINDVI
jgi:hypothetical protein